jgi:hypothetical protein
MLLLKMKKSIFSLLRCKYKQVVGAEKKDHSNLTTFLLHSERSFCANFGDGVIDPNRTDAFFLIEVN